MDSSAELVLAKLEKDRTSLNNRVCKALRMIWGMPATRHHAGWHCRVNLGEPGWPDVIAVLPWGAFLGVDTKRQGEEIRPSQREKWAEIRDCCAHVITVTSLAELKLKVDEIYAARCPERGA